MQAIMESIFDVGYLSLAVILGILILKTAKNKESKLFGIMALILVFGDSFHLIPRIIGLRTGNMETLVPALGFGTLVASISMTVFYVLLYKVWKLHYNKTNIKTLDITIVLLAAVRVILCLFPQNDWFVADAPLAWGIIRNIPFLIIGIIVLVLFYRESRNKKDSYRHMWIAIALSFAFYLPVVLLAGKYPIFGAFMLPKTVAYIWIIIMGYENAKLSCIN